MYALITCYTDKHTREGDIVNKVLYSSHIDKLELEMKSKAELELKEMCIVANISLKTKTKLLKQVNNSITQKKKPVVEYIIKTEDYENKEDKDYFIWRQKKRKIEITYFEDYGFEVMKFKIQKLEELIS